MATKKAIIFLAITIAIMALIIGLQMISNQNPDTSTDNNSFRLTFPPFLGDAAAAGVSTTGFPDNEAGICAYLRPVGSLNVDTAKSAFWSIDNETDDFIIGTIRVTNMHESESPYVYIDSNGWIISYYPKSIRNFEAYIVPLGYDEATTNLAEAIKKVGEALEGYPVNYNEIKYYDFRYPDATNMLVIKEEHSGFFYVEIPNTFIVYNATWIYDCTYTTGAYVTLDEWEFVSGGDLPGGLCKVGYFSQSLLEQDVMHTFHVADADFGLVIIYSSSQ